MSRNSTQSSAFERAEKRTDGWTSRLKTDLTSRNSGLDEVLRDEVVEQGADERVTEFKTVGEKIGEILIDVHDLFVVGQVAVDVSKVYSEDV